MAARIHDGNVHGYALRLSLFQSGLLYGQGFFHSQIPGQMRLGTGSKSRGSQYQQKGTEEGKQTTQHDRTPFDPQVAADGNCAKGRNAVSCTLARRRRGSKPGSRLACLSVVILTP